MTKRRRKKSTKVTSGAKEKQKEKKRKYRKELRRSLRAEGGRGRGGNGTEQDNISKVEEKSDKERIKRKLKKGEDDDMDERGGGYLFPRRPA